MSKETLASFVQGFLEWKNMSKWRNEKITSFTSLYLSFKVQVWLMVF